MPLLYDRDPAVLFLDIETQNILKSITQFRFDKFFRKAVVSEDTEYKFMTDAELNSTLGSMTKVARRNLQMIPIVKVYKGYSNNISQDFGLKTFSGEKFIITDISFGLNQSFRRIVNRQADGNLEYTRMDTSKRINQLYFPLNGRKIKTPLMFRGKHLEECLNSQKYEFILDRLSLQYEPYEREFHDISSKVYMHINKNGHFDVLRSTRHFGPMAFFLAWHKIIDDLLCDTIKRNYVKNCIEVIALFYKLNGIQKDYRSVMQKIDNFDKYLYLDCKGFKDDFRVCRNNSPAANYKNADLAKFSFVSEASINFIEDYINQHAFKKIHLELALQVLKDIFNK